MKKIFLFLVIILAVGCQKEDFINAPLGKVRRNYDVNSSDQILKYVSQYYVDYGKEFLVDPDSSDWLYNFQVKNKVKIKAPQNDKAYLLAGIKLIEELFINSYPKDMIKKYFPYQLILAEEIRTPGAWSSSPDIIHDTFFARNFLALNIGPIGTTFTEQKKVAISEALNKAFIVNFLLQNHLKTLNLNGFYNSGAAYYGKVASKKLSDAELNKLGFVKVTFSYADKTTYPSFTEHAQFWVEFILSTPKDKIEETLAKYPVMRTNHDLILKELKQNINLDLVNLVYKAK